MYGVPSAANAVGGMAGDLLAPVVASTALDDRDQAVVAEPFAGVQDRRPVLRAVHVRQRVDPALPRVTLLDTHAWIWHLTAPQELSVIARTALKRARRERGVLVSAISVWELFMLVKKGRLVLTITPQALLRRAERLSYLQFVAVDHHMARRSVVLPDIHADPADRLIVATAQALDCTLISKDRRLRRYPDVEVIW